VAAERFFLDALDKFCEAEGIGEGRPRGKMVLCGHSLGGHLAAIFALEQPQHVQHLVLICPAGLPEQPPGWRDGLHARVAEASGRFSLRPALVRWAEGAWDAGTTHGSIIRALGPWGGEQLMRRYASGRFSSSSGPPPAPGGGGGAGGNSDGASSNNNNNDSGKAGGERASPPAPPALSPEEAGVVGSYLWELTALEGSGEHALRHILGFGAFAHAPLGKRLEALSPSVPVTFCYGSRDWMKPEHAVAAAARLDALRERVAEHDHDVIVLPDCGHFPFLEKPAAFDEAMARILRQYGGGRGVHEAAAAAAPGEEEGAAAPAAR
jgi:pimeloyl-ACP methyl ester carboxylesterase